MKMTFQEIRIIATDPCITNQLRDVNIICRRSWYIAAHILKIYDFNDSNVLHQNPTFLSEQILQLIFFQITPSKVLDILQIFKLGKASGLESISHQML
jgi:hypothetical protein